LFKEILGAVEEAQLNGEIQTKAQVGDKTMMDALVPAVKAFRETPKAWKSIRQALQDAAEAVERGDLATTELKARFGRAKILGDRTLGSQDPAVTSISLLSEGILRASRKSKDQVNALDPSWANFDGGDGNGVSC
jgi:dihydroxyacetone kinase-like protein